MSFTGIVAKDCEQRQLPSGQTVLHVTVANHIGFGDRQKTLWISCTVWGKQAGQMQKYLIKGEQVFVSGELSQSQYRAQDGTDRTSLELSVKSIDLVGRKNEPRQEPPSNTNSSSQPSFFHDVNAEYDSKIPFPDDDIPF